MEFQEEKQTSGTSAQTSDEAQNFQKHILKMSELHDIMVDDNFSSTTHMKHGKYDWCLPCMCLEHHRVCEHLCKVFSW